MFWCMKEKFPPHFPCLHTGHSLQGQKHTPTHTCHTSHPLPPTPAPPLPTHTHTHTACPTHTHTPFAHTPCPHAPHHYHLPACHPFYTHFLPPTPHTHTPSPTPHTLPAHTPPPHTHPTTPSSPSGWWVGPLHTPTPHLPPPCPLPPLPTPAHTLCTLPRDYHTPPPTTPHHPLPHPHHTLPSPLVGTTDRGRTHPPHHPLPLCHPLPAFTTLSPPCLFGNLGCVVFWEEGGWAGLEGVGQGSGGGVGRLGPLLLLLLLLLSLLLWWMMGGSSLSLLSLLSPTYIPYTCPTYIYDSLCSSFFSHVTCIVFQCSSSSIWQHGGNNLCSLYVSMGLFTYISPSLMWQHGL